MTNAQLGKVNGYDSSQARTDLISLYRSPLVKTAFRNAYLEEAITQFPAVFKTGNVKSRLNTMIVIAQLNSRLTFDILSAGLKDDNFGVRYWAIKGIDKLMGTTGNPAINAAQQTALSNQLINVIPGESSVFVLKLMYEVFAKIPNPKARQDLFKLLNARLTKHRQKITSSIIADYSGIAQLLNQLKLLKLRGINVNNDFKELAIITAKYLQVISGPVVNKTLKGSTLNETVGFIATADQVFSETLKTYDTNAAPGPKLVAPTIEASILASLEWIGESPDKPGLLTTSAIGIPYNQLQLPGAP